MARQRIPSVGGASGADVRHRRSVLPFVRGADEAAGVVKEPDRIARYLAAVGEGTEVPGRSPSRGPPYWKSQVLRRKVLGDEEDWGCHGGGANEVA